MKYNVKLETTVEAASAEAAKQVAFTNPSECGSPVQIEVLPDKKWRVTVNFATHHIFTLTVCAESAEDAESKAYSLAKTLRLDNPVAYDAELVEQVGDDAVVLQDISGDQRAA